MSLESLKSLAYGASGEIEPATRQRAQTPPLTRGGRLASTTRRPI